MDTADHPLAQVLDVPFEPPAPGYLPLHAAEVFNRYANKVHDLYVGDAITDKWRTRIFERAELPGWEDVLAFVDLTAFGKAKDFLAFGAAGVYYRQLVHKGARFQPWERVLRHRVGFDEGADDHQIRIGEAFYLLAGSMIDHQDLAALIDELGGWAPLSASSRLGNQDTLLAPATGDPAGLAAIARQFAQVDRFFVGDAVSAKHERNAREHAVIPDEETIVALLDCTYWRSGKDVLVLTSGGIRHHNVMDDDTPTFVSWSGVEKVVVDYSSSFGESRLVIGGKPLTVIAENQDLASLTEMVTAMARHMCPSGTGPQQVSEQRSDPGREAVPNVRRAENDQEFIESAFFLAHTFDGLQLAPLIAEEIRVSVDGLLGLAPAESIVAAVSYEEASNDLFVLTTLGIRYQVEQPDSAPAFQSWEQLRLVLSRPDVRAIESSDKVSAGIVSYSIDGSDADIDEMEALIRFLAFRAPHAAD